MRLVVIHIEIWIDCQLLIRWMEIKDGLCQIMASIRLLLIKNIDNQVQGLMKLILYLRKLISYERNCFFFPKSNEGLLFPHPNEGDVFKEGHSRCFKIKTPQQLIMWTGNLCALHIV